MASPSNSRPKRQQTGKRKVADQEPSSLDDVAEDVARRHNLRLMVEHGKELWKKENLPPETLAAGLKVADPVVGARLQKELRVIMQDWLKLKAADSCIERDVCRALLRAGQEHKKRTKHDSSASSESKDD